MYHSVGSHRYGKAKGMKVKHLVQLVSLIVLFTWLLYQVNSSHKAKVLSRRAEKAENLDDDLLITADNSSGLIGAVVAHEVVDQGAVVADEELIDKRSLRKSRELKPLDRSEFEQLDAEAERSDDVPDDSGEDIGDGSTAISKEYVRQTEELEMAIQGIQGEKDDGVEEHESSHKQDIEITEDGGDGEDELEQIVEKGNDSAQEKSGSNLGAITGDDIPERRQELAGSKSSETIVITEDGRDGEDELDQIAEKGNDSTQEKSGSNTGALTGDDIPERRQELAGSKSSERSAALETDIAEDVHSGRVDAEDLQAKQDEAKSQNAMGDISLEMGSDLKVQDEKALPLSSIGASTAQIERLEDLVNDKVPNVTGKEFSPKEYSREQTIISGSSIEDDTKFRTEGSDVNLPADAIAGQGNEVGHILRTKTTGDDETILSAEDGGLPSDLTHDGREEPEEEANHSRAAYDRKDQQERTTASWE